MAYNDGVLIDNFTIDDLPNDILQDIYCYWLEIKGEHSMPRRANLNPADIVRLLPHISLVDVDTKTNRYKMRLIGTEVAKAMGSDITGKYLDEIPLVECHLKPRYDWIVKEKRPYLIADQLKWSSKSYMNFCSIGLPFSDNGHDINIIMYGSCFHFPEDTPIEFSGEPDWIK